jgi:hypothetical protein
MSDKTELVLDTPQDDALLARLRRVAGEADPPPPLAYDLARAAFSLRDLDAELAVLTLDSAEPGQELAGVRGSDEIRLLSYEAQAVGVELQVVTHGDRRSLTGQVVGPLPESVVVETDTEAHVVRPDESGVFDLDDLPSGRVRVRLDVSGGVTVSTPWVAL